MGFYFSVFIDLHIINDVIIAIILTEGSIKDIFGNISPNITTLSIIGFVSVI